MKLTNESVARLKLPPDKADAIMWDDALPAFGLRVQGKKKSWVIQYRSGDAKQRRLTVATVEQLSVTDARKKAGELLAGVKLGHDPAEDKRARIEKANAPRPMTLGEAAEAYLLHARAKLKPRSYAEVERHLRQHWQPVAKAPLATITRADVAKQLGEITKRGPFAANRARATLSTLFNWAMSKGLTDASPVMGTKPETREISRDRVLSDEELRLVWENAGEGDYGAIMRMLILTGQRRDEVGAMSRPEVDLDKAVWTIPGERTKNRRAHDVPLSEEAITILKGIPKRDGRDLVFGSREGPFSGWSKAKVELDERIAKAGGEVKPWRLHDLRRTTATRMVDLGVLPHVVEAVINHVSGHKAGVAGVYNRAVYANEKRRALELWAERVKAIINGRSNVVAVKRGAA